MWDIDISSSFKYSNIPPPLDQRQKKFRMNTMKEKHLKTNEKIKHVCKEKTSHKENGLKIRVELLSFKQDLLQILLMN